MPNFASCGARGCVDPRPSPSPKMPLLRRSERRCSSAASKPTRKGGGRGGGKSAAAGWWAASAACVGASGWSETRSSDGRDGRVAHDHPAEGRRGRRRRVDRPGRPVRLRAVVRRSRRQGRREAARREGQYAGAVMQTPAEAESGRYGLSEGAMQVMMLVRRDMIRTERNAVHRGRLTARARLPPLHSGKHHPHGGAGLLDHRPLCRRQAGDRRPAA